MTELILQAYLNQQHIKTDVPENIESLKKAVKELISKLTNKKVRTEIISFTLVALDPKVKETDPVVQQVEAIIIKKWPAFKNSVTATKDKSITYIRAVILESLSHLSIKDETTAALVWLTARDVIEHYQLDSEENVIKEFLQELANRTEKNGQVLWGNSKRFKTEKLKAPKIANSEVKNVEIDEEALKVHLIDANVHSGWNPQAGGGKNPYSQGQNNLNWPKFMAEHSAKGITEVINSALSEQTESFSSITTSIQKNLNTYLAQLPAFSEDLSNSIANDIQANNKRSELLWWKQSLYSRSLNTSYRSLDPLNAAVGMAFDLSKQVEPFYPESVDYLLRETLKDVHGEQVEEVGLLTDWLKDGSNLHRDIQSTLNQHSQGGDERKSLLSGWANVLQAGETTAFFTETGIDKNAKLTLSDLAVWLFHGLQAKKLATAK